MTDRLKVGIAGCGAIARQVHLPLLAARPDVAIHALVDADIDALSEASTRVRGARPYATIADMLAESRPDAVIVALPTAEHALAASAVLHAGCDLYLEKPLTAGLTEAAPVLDAWRASGRIGMMGFNERFNPLHCRLRDLLRSGRAGNPVFARTVFSVGAAAVPDWKRRRATGGGALLDLGSHRIDLMRFLFGREVVAVQATIESRRTEDDTVLVELELEEGPRVQGFFSLAAAEHDQIEVFGERARLAVSRFTSLDVAIVDNPGEGGGAAARMLRRVGALRQLPAAWRARRSPLREPGYAIALDRFVAAVRSRRLDADAADLDAGLACLAVIAAAERSARSGRREVVDARPPTSPSRHASLQESGP